MIVTIKVVVVVVSGGSYQIRSKLCILYTVCRLYYMQYALNAVDRFVGSLDKAV